MLHNKLSDYKVYSYESEMAPLVPIAPASDRKLTLDLQIEKRRYTCKNNPYTGAQAASIARRNARERNRVKQVNDSYNNLRKKLPAAVISALSGGSRRGSGKKLSKVDTLRMVVEYIRYLENLIDESDASLGVKKDTSAMTAPMDTYEGFNGRLSPYSESVPSPVDSECSSGVSSAYSSENVYYSNYPVNQVSPTEEYSLIDAISWWQQK